MMKPFYDAAEIMQYSIIDTPDYISDMSPCNIDIHSRVTRHGHTNVN